MNPHSNKRGGFILFVVILIAAALILFSFCFYKNGLKAVGSNKDIELRIESGKGLKEIAATLSQARIIRSNTVFKLYAIFTGKARRLKAGLYDLNSNMSVREIIDILMRGSNQEVSVTILEGTTLKEIDKVLSAANVIPKDSLKTFNFKAELAANYPFLTGIDSLEGFLYPDTYRFKTNSRIEEVVKKFVDNFQNKTWPLVGQKSDWYQILILASILEKEVLTFKDQQIVAGIFNKRLKVGMPLQADATIVYAKCQGDFSSCPKRNLLYSDLKMDSSYNSYLNLGLPPTPIANVNLTTIKAALTPKASNYWFYLSASQTKETIFSETLEEHNINRQKYL